MTKYGNLVINFNGKMVKFPAGWLEHNIILSAASFNQLFNNSDYKRLLASSKKPEMFIVVKNGPQEIVDTVQFRNNKFFSDNTFQIATVNFEKMSNYPTIPKKTI